MPIRPENRDRYPKEWPEISRRIRFERAQSQCECIGECGRNTHRGRCPNVNGAPAYGTGSRVVGARRSGERDRRREGSGVRTSESGGQLMAVTTTAFLAHAKTPDVMHGQEAH